VDIVKRACRKLMKYTRGARESADEGRHRKEVEYNMKHYGVPILSGTHHVEEREHVPSYVRDVLFEEMTDKLVRISVYPEDEDGQRWGVDYDLLVWDNEYGFVKAIDIEQAKRRR
jgi:hypothetical protein